MTPFPTAFPSLLAEVRFVQNVLRDSRDVHQWWADAIVAGKVGEKEQRFVGNPGHHLYHIRKYNRVLALLDQLVTLTGRTGERV